RPRLCFVTAVPAGPTVNPMSNPVSVDHAARRLFPFYHLASSFSHRPLLPVLSPSFLPEGADLHAIVEGPIEPALAVPLLSLSHSAGGTVAGIKGRRLLAGLLRFGCCDGGAMARRWIHAQPHWSCPPAGPVDSGGLGLGSRGAEGGDWSRSPEDPVLQVNPRSSPRGLWARPPQPTARRRVWPPDLGRLWVAPWQRTR
ncbi:unnamed protein product, partial [Urochloa humidicola]